MIFDSSCLSSPLDAITGNTCLWPQSTVDVCPCLLSYTNARLLHILLILRFQCENPVLINESPIIQKRSLVGETVPLSQMISLAFPWLLVLQDPHKLEAYNTFLRISDTPEEAWAFDSQTFSIKMEATVFSKFIENCLSCIVTFSCFSNCNYNLTGLYIFLSLLANI